jgi:hypothetical protein
VHAARSIFRNVNEKVLLSRKVDWFPNAFISIQGEINCQGSVNMLRGGLGQRHPCGQK